MKHLAPFLRHGHVYGAIDVTLLKQAMDMSTNEWAHPEAGLGWLNKLLNAGKPVQNALALHDAVEAVGTIKEHIVGIPEIKVVVYSGHKTRMSQADSAGYAFGASKPWNALGDGHFVRVERPGGIYDSAYQARAHLRGKHIGTVVTLPDWRP